MHKFYSAVRRLQILLGGESHDIFAADIYYHQSCYIKFAIKDIRDSKSESHINQQKIDDVLEIFLQRIKIKIVRETSAFLLNELLKDISSLGKEKGLTEPPIANTRSLKRLIVEST